MTYTYVITEEPAFHDEPVEFTLQEARKTRRQLQRQLDLSLAGSDAPAIEVKIYKILEVK